MFLASVRSIVQREKNFGLAKQWFFAWEPESNAEVAFILEDDIEVSDDE
jgi:hypothetical protein